MSDQQRRIGGGRRRTQEEANLSQEEAIKKQKNREAAKKHREKKEKNLMALKKENELLEAKNEEYTEKQKRLKELIAQAETIIQQHREAGCCLPEELANLKSRSDKSLQRKPVAALKSSPVLTAPANTIEDSVNTEGQKDAMALFSGEALSACPVPYLVRPSHNSAPSVETPVVPKVCNSAATLEKQVVARVYRPPAHLMLTQATPPNRHIAPAGNSVGQSQPATQHVPASFTFNPQGHQVLKFKAAPPSSPAMVSNSTSAVSHQHVGHALKTNVFQVSGTTCKLILRGGNYHLFRKAVPQYKQNTCIESAGQNSPLSPDDTSSIGSEAYQEDEGCMDTHQAPTLTGNIPCSELLEGVEESTHSSASEDFNKSVDEMRQDSWDNGQHGQYDHYNHALLQQESSIDQGYSYTDDLNLSEPPQHILRQIQGHTYTLTHLQHTRDAVQMQQGAAGLINPDSSVYSDLDVIPASLNPVQTLTTTSNYPPEEQRHERTNRCVKTHVACAPAILDMLSESEVLPSLQDKIMESLSHSL